MAKNKLTKFAEMEKFPHVFQLSSNEILAGKSFKNKGKWHAKVFKNDNPIVLELGCGRGEYTIGLANLYPNKNFIGVDIKGARMWTGAKASLEKGMQNVAFLRTSIEMIQHFFTENEVDEIWLTFPDPQMKKTNKRMTATNFIKNYQKFVKNKGLIHLKTDSNFMFTYTKAMLEANEYSIDKITDDLYATATEDPVLNIKTFYEQQWLDRGLTIKYIRFFLEKKDKLIEPDITIEKDNYRSFNRNKRTQL